MALAWGAHGCGSRICGVYESREAAFEGIKDMPNMTVYVDRAGIVRGHPRKERTGLDLLRRDAVRLPEQWAEARPWTVMERADRGAGC